MGRVAARGIVSENFSGSRTATRGRATRTARLLALFGIAAVLFAGGCLRNGSEQPLAPRGGAPDDSAGDSADSPLDRTPLSFPQETPEPTPRPSPTQTPTATVSLVPTATPTAQAMDEGAVDGDGRDARAADQFEEGGLPDIPINAEWDEPGLPPAAAVPLEEAQTGCLLLFAPSDIDAAHGSGRWQHRLYLRLICLVGVGGTRAAG